MHTRWLRKLGSRNLQLLARHQLISNHQLENQKIVHYQLLLNQLAPQHQQLVDVHHQLADLHRHRHLPHLRRLWCCGHRLLKEQELAGDQVLVKVFLTFGPLTGNQVLAKVFFLLLVP